MTPTFIQVFVKLPCLCQVRGSGYLVRGFIKKLINIHTPFDGGGRHPRGVGFSLVPFEGGLVVLEFFYVSA